MDPFTHTLVGASLAASKLGRKTDHASAALVIGANLPDIDVFSYAAGGDVALCIRRGWTHGILALVVLPAVLALLLLFWGRWRAVGRGRRGGGISVPWLFGLTYLAVLTHPALDWLNTYGMRWLMPFRDTWYYGDAVFIVDPWLWLVLGGGWLLGRRATLSRVGVLGLVVAMPVWGVASRAPDFVPLVLAVAVGWLAALLVPVRDERRSSQVAVGGLLVGTLYVCVLLTLQAKAESTVREMLTERLGGAPAALMVGPVPADPLSWDVVAVADDELRWGRFSWRQRARLVNGRLDLAAGAVPAAQSLPVWREILASGEAEGFLGWARFPWLEEEATVAGRRIHIMDARYARSRTPGFGGAQIELPSAPASGS